MLEDELQIYEKNGLFHNITKSSAIMNGRYAAIVDGADFNVNNIIAKLDSLKSQFPMVACQVPFSLVNGVDAGFPGIEDYVFRMYFVCRTGSTGDNQTKVKDPLTNTSLHNAKFDASDMKKVCFSFMRALEKLERKTKQRIFIIKTPQQYRIDRIISMNNANLSGVYITFILQVPFQCDQFTDVDLTGIDAFLTVPEHAEHFH